MKKRLTLSIDPDVVAMAKRYAQSRGMSLSALVEQYLDKQTRLGEQSNASRWRGKFEPAEKHGDPRYDFLAKKYLD